MKINKILIKTFIETFNEIFDENHMILNNFSDETEVDQNLIFSSINMIIAEKIIFVIENSDSDCSAFLSDYKSIKINMLNILKLTYNNMITQYNN